MTPHKLTQPLKLSLFLVLILAFLGLIPASIATAGGTTRYVAPTGTNAGNCSSSSAPCRALQYAVNQAASGDIILAAQGTYTFDATVSYPCPAWTSSVVCFINKDVTILGGYTTSNWATPNPSAHLTILDGQNAYRGLMSIAYNTPNIYTLRMEGFTIQNGLAQPIVPGDINRVGGGMYIQHTGVILRDMVFRNNRALGQNTTSGDGGKADGGAIRIESSPQSVTSLLERVVFDNNQSIGGSGPDRGGIAFGAVFIYNSIVVAEDTTFTDNLARGGDSTGSGTSAVNGLHADALGGAIAVENAYLTLNRTTVTGNQARGGNAGNSSNAVGGGGYGGGIFAEGYNDGNAFTSITSLSMTDAYIARNTATGGDAYKGGNSAGGGINLTHSYFTLNRAEVVHNTSYGGNATMTAGQVGPGGGGGIYIFSLVTGMPEAFISNTIIGDNLAIQGVGGNASLGNGGGGGIVVQGMNATLSHTTIANNRLDPGNPGLILGQGIGILPWFGANPIPATVHLNHSIVANHTVGSLQAAAIIVQWGTTLHINQGLLAGNDRDTNVNGQPIAAGTITGLDTMLSVSAAGLISPGEPHQNYHLRADSAARDQATNSSATEDFEGQPRPNGGFVDLGADEYWPFALQAIPGDGTLKLGWVAGASNLTGGVSYYQVIVTCPNGATPPDQGACGEPLNTGNATTFTLTGLTNYAPYTLQIRARDASDELVAASINLTAFPTDLLIFIPIAIR